MLLRNCALRLRWVVCVGLAYPGAIAAAPTVKNTPKPPLVDTVAALANLTSADVAQAVKAANELAASSEPRVHEALLDALAFGPHPQFVAAALVALAAHPVAADVPVVVNFARNRNSAVRAAALTALGAYKHASATRALLGGLRDQDASVRAAAAQVLGAQREKAAIQPLLALLAKGDEPAARALAQLADADFARKLAEQIGELPDAPLAQCLGALLLRDDFGPDSARSQVVAAIGKIPSSDAISALTEYIEKTPKNPPRASRREAEALVEARLGGNE